MATKFLSFEEARDKEKKKALVMDTSCIKEEVTCQKSYCLNIEANPKTFDEAMKWHDAPVQKKGH